MATPGRTRVRHSLVVSFDSPEERAAFRCRLEHIRSLLTPMGQPNLDNSGLMTAMFDHVEEKLAHNESFPGSERAFVQSFNRDCGKFLTILVVLDG